jgi:hypothetical protein
MDALPPLFVSPRATAIAKGLAITGRAGEAVVVGAWLKAQARRGNRSEFYFVHIADGTRLLRGTGWRMSLRKMNRTPCYDLLAMVLPFSCPVGVGADGVERALMLPSCTS